MFGVSCELINVTKVQDCNNCNEVEKMWRNQLDMLRIMLLSSFLFMHVIWFMISFRSWWKLFMLSSNFVFILHFFNQLKNFKTELFKPLSRGFVVRFGSNWTVVDCYSQRRLHVPCYTFINKFIRYMALSCYFLNLR